jgi:hypothetical protein
MAIEILSSRILDIAEDELYKRSLGLEILGLDVRWGNWPVQTPKGAGTATTFAILVAARLSGPKGEVLLGNQPPVVNAHTLTGGVWPSETEIRQGIAISCDALRQHMLEVQAEQNGQGGPIADIVKEAWRKRQGEST